MSRKTDKLPLKRGVIEKAIQLYASKANITHSEVSRELNIDKDTLYRIRRSPDFWSQVYDYYMVTFDGAVVRVLKSMIREAEAGNVQAGRLVLEHSGKLQKNINITVMSPFEKWQKMNKNDIDDAEVVDEFQELPAELKDYSDLPVRDAKKAKNKSKKEKRIVNKIITDEDRRKRRNEARKLMRAWQKRAKAVGVDQLPARRPTPGQREAWEKEIIKREKKA